MTAKETRKEITKLHAKNEQGLHRPTETNTIVTNDIQLVPVVGLEPTRLFMVPGF